MAEQTDIAWCDHTQNFWIGCTEVSPACDHCYARVMATRYGWAVWGKHPRKRTSAQNWNNPLKWNAKAREAGVRRRVFTLSLGDFFDNQVPVEWRQEAWEIIRACEGLDWLVLTKRPQNIAKMLPTGWGQGWPHVWLGTTVEAQRYVKQRLTHLLKVPARHHFVSAEPLIGPLNLRPWLQQGLDWVIVGGESGAVRRPFDWEWVRDLLAQCQVQERAFFMKQACAFRPRDADIPPELLIREWPA
jgi:protein gp37